MGAVYAAVHARNGKRVAVKVLHPGIDGSDVLARFQREGYLANLVDDPGVVAAFDDGVTDEGVAFPVMELLEGESIEDRAQRCGGRLPWSEILAIVHPALKTLEKAHAAGVVHRDLKPSNLFLTKGGQIKLLDFGLAGHTVGGPGARLTGPMTPTMGTLGFMPAEQALGDWPNVDGRSDLWSMGATMFALATGLCPHESGNEESFFHRVLTASAPRLADLVPDAPQSFAAIVDRALLRDRAARFGTAGEMADAVQRVFYELTGEDVELVSSGEQRLVPSPRRVELEEETTLSEAARGAPPTLGKHATLASPAPSPATAPASLLSEDPPSQSRERRTRGAGRVLAWAVGAGLIAAVGFALVRRTTQEGSAPASPNPDPAPVGSSSTGPPASALASAPTASAPVVSFAQAPRSRSTTLPSAAASVAPSVPVTPSVAAAPSAPPRSIAPTGTTAAPSGAPTVTATAKPFDPNRRY